MKKYLIYLLLGFLVYSVKAQVPAPGKKASGGILIVNAILHDGNGRKTENAWLRADGAKITATGTGQPDEKSSAGAQKIDAGGSHLYPGFILMNNPLGLSEIEAVRATLDFQETGSDNPNIHTLPAYNTDSEIIPTLRLNGILTAQITPRGGRISGLSSVVQLDAWNWEDAVLKERDGLHLNWPSRWNRQGWWAEPSSAVEKNKDYQKQVDELRQLFSEAAQYNSVAEKSLNPKLEALALVLAGKVRLYLHASTSAEILASLEFTRSAGIKGSVLVAGPEVLDIIPYLKENAVPVILNRLHDLPLNAESPVFQQMRIPFELHKAGILFALDYEGSMEVMGSRNLGFLAGATRAYGLPEEDALSLITRNPARILGMEKTTGTLEPGKDATFFLSKGNALEMKGQELSRAWIQGREIRLESKQTQLYQKFGKMLSEGR
jgi:imidazolonepropionase-like amidohydrolase